MQEQSHQGKNADNPHSHSSSGLRDVETSALKKGNQWTCSSGQRFRSPVLGITMTLFHLRAEKSTFLSEGRFLPQATALQVDG